MMRNKKMMLIMVLCCAIPLVALFALSAFGVSLGNGPRIAIFLLCPVLHFVMMRAMHGKGKENEEHDAAHAVIKDRSSNKDSLTGPVITSKTNRVT